jgi:hypothetical protein
MFWCCFRKRGFVTGHTIPGAPDREGRVEDESGPDLGLSFIDQSELAESGGE